MHASIIQYMDKSWICVLFRQAESSACTCMHAANNVSPVWFCLRTNRSWNCMAIWKPPCPPENKNKTRKTKYCVLCTRIFAWLMYWNVELGCILFERAKIWCSHGSYGPPNSNSLVVLPVVLLLLGSWVVQRFSSLSFFFHFVANNVGVYIWHRSVVSWYVSLSRSKQRWMRLIIHGWLLLGELDRPRRRSNPAAAASSPRPFLELTAPHAHRPYTDTR